MTLTTRIATSTAPAILFHSKLEDIPKAPRMKLDRNALAPEAGARSRALSGRVAAPKKWLEISPDRLRCSMAESGFFAAVFQPNPGRMARARQPIFLPVRRQARV